MVLGSLYQGWVGHDKTDITCRVFRIQNEARTRAGKGKSFICAVLGAALKTAVEFRDEKHSACLQMMYDRKMQPHCESPMMMPVDPERMIALIRGLPESLKPIGIQLQGKIQATSLEERTRAVLEGTITSNHLQSGYKV